MAAYDVIVIGGGSAGTSAARSATLAGARTALINDGELGGLCILRGCMPTKAMLAAAHPAHEVRCATRLGLRFEGRIEADFERIMSRKDELVARFQRAKIEAVEAQDYEVIFGRARFAAGGGLDVGGRVFQGRRYVIATGSVPVVPDLPGLAEVPYLTSDDVMRLRSRPASIVIYGAGPIGLELSQFFARVGTQVLLVNRGPLLRRYDAEAGDELRRALEDEPRLELALPASFRHVRRGGSGIELELEVDGSRRRHRADALLVATGRRAALDDLGLEHVGLQVVDGRLEHDAGMRTANPDVLIAGDATGRHQILHLANQEGRVAGHNAAAAEPSREMSYRLKMSVIFTDPPVAQVGLTAPEVERARHEGRLIIESVVRFAETGRAITMGIEHGLWKLFVDEASCRAVGSAIVGPHADELIHLVAMMMHYGGRIDDVIELPWYHPTLSEVMINLERDVAGRIRGCEKAPAPPA